MSLFKQRLKRLSVKRKLVLIGSALTVLASFLPWYSDIDRFNIGDTFLGITGPLYLLGMVTLIVAGASLTYMLMKLLGKKLPGLPLSEGRFYLMNSIISLGMLLLATSIYLHPKFGISLADKTLGMGLMIGFVATGINLVGAWMSRDDRVELADSVSIETPIFEEEPEMIQNYQRPAQNIHKNREQTVEEAMRAHYENSAHNTNEIR